MRRQTRNHSITGVALLLGAAAVAFGATQTWATGAVSVVWGRLAGLTPHGGLGFDLLLAPGGQYGNVKPLLLGGSAVFAVLALLLFLTRGPGLGVLWRIFALLTVALLALAAFDAWRVVNEPALVIADSSSPLGGAIDFGVSLAESSGLLAVEPGPGLWLLSIGTVVAGIGALIPAIRGHAIEPPVVGAGVVDPTTFRMSAGWYPDQLDQRFVRYFDGVQWTSATRPRG